MSSTTNQKLATDKRVDVVHQISLASDSANTQKWKNPKTIIEEEKPERKCKEQQLERRRE